MKIAFVQDLFYEWQAPMQFSALARLQGYECTMVIDKIPERAAKKVLQYKADVVVFSTVITGSHWYVIKTAEIIKQNSAIPILVGGPHPSLCTNLIEIPSIDYLCKGEGDLTFTMLLNRIDKGGSLDQVPGLWYKDKHNNICCTKPAPLINLDELPTLDRGLYYRYKIFKHEKTRYIYFSRGCKYDCKYCCVPVVRSVCGIGPRLRYRSPKLVCDEINAIHTQYGIKYVSFQEDTFAQNHDWLKEFLNRYMREVKKPFVCMLTAEDINENIARKLKTAGCVGALLAVDTGNEKTRNELLGRKTRNDEYIKVAALLKRFGIQISTINLLGLPGETLADAEDTIAFNRRLNVDYPWAMLYRPYPNTALEKEIERLGLIDPSESRSSKEKNLYCSSLLQQPEIKQLENLQKLFSFTVKFPRLNTDFVLRQNHTFKLYYNLFCLYSYYREVRFWKRSALITLYSGIKNYSK